MKQLRKTTTAEKTAETTGKNRQKTLAKELISKDHGTGSYNASKTGSSKETKENPMKNSKDNT